MNTTDPLEYWKSRRMEVQVDDAFADQVLKRIGHLARPARQRPGGSIWARPPVGAAIAAAVLLGVTVCLVQLCIATGLVLGLASQGH